MELLGVELEVALDLEPGALLGHVIGVQHDVGVRAGDLLAELAVRHGHGTLGALGAHRTHAPAQLGDAGIEVVLREKHVAHKAIRNLRHVLAVAPEWDVGELVVRVRARSVVQHVRTHPVAHAHPGDEFLDQLAAAHLHGCLVDLVGGVELDRPAVGHLEDQGRHPAPIPNLGDANLLILGVEPCVFLNRPGALGVQGSQQAGGLATL